MLSNIFFNEWHSRNLSYVWNTVTVGMCFNGYSGEAGLTVKIADTHAESNWFGGLCVEKGLRHLGFVHSLSHSSVQDMKTHMWNGKIRVYGYFFIVKIHLVGVTGIL